MAKKKARADGRYQISIYVGSADGKPKRKVVYGASLKEAEAKAAALRAI